MDNMLLNQYNNRIIATKGTDTLADVSYMGAQIDNLVYQLYGLIDDEIKIIEENSK